MARSKKTKVRLEEEPVQDTCVAESAGEKHNLGTAEEVAAEIATKCDLVRVGCGCGNRSCSDCMENCRSTTVGRRKRT
jgi:predicted Rossmann-fold nucleotide-binding protein